MAPRKLGNLQELFRFRRKFWLANPDNSPQPRLAVPCAGVGGGRFHLDSVHAVPSIDRSNRLSAGCLVLDCRSRPWPVVLLSAAAPRRGSGTELSVGRSGPAHDGAVGRDRPRAAAPSLHRPPLSGPGRGDGQPGGPPICQPPARQPPARQSFARLDQRTTQPECTRPSVCRTGAERQSPDGAIGRRALDRRQSSRRSAPGRRALRRTLHARRRLLCRRLSTGRGLRSGWPLRPRTDERLWRLRRLRPMRRVSQWVHVRARFLWPHVCVVRTYRQSSGAAQLERVYRRKASRGRPTWA